MPCRKAIAQLHRDNYYLKSILLPTLTETAQESKAQFDSLLASVDTIQELAAQVERQIRDRVSNLKLQGVTQSSALRAREDEIKTLHAQLAYYKSNLRTGDAQIQEIMPALTRAKAEAKSLQVLVSAERERNCELSGMIAYLEEERDRLIQDNTCLRSQIQVHLYIK